MNNAREEQHGIKQLTATLGILSHLGDAARLGGVRLQRTACHKVPAKKCSSCSILSHLGDAARLVRVRLQPADGVQQVAAVVGGVDGRQEADVDAVLQHVVPELLQRGPILQFAFAPLE